MDSPEKKRARRSQTASTAAALSISSSSPSASFASPSASSSSSSAAAASMASIALSVTDLFGPSPLQKDRLADVPALPAVLQLDHSTQELGVSVGKPTKAAGDDAEIAAQFPFLYGQPPIEFDSKVPKKSKSPHVTAAAAAAAAERSSLLHLQQQQRKDHLRVGVVLSGGQASGGHNVIAGLYDFIKKSTGGQGAVLGFRGGPKGIFTGDVMELTDAEVAKFRNMGGFHIIGSGRDKIHTEQQFADSLAHCRRLNLHGLVVIGGDDSNTNACVLAEYFKKHESGIAVVGCPKTIDGDLKNEHVHVSFGFDTACRLYSEIIGNLSLDALSDGENYHFVRLMGRSASHVTLECALKTKANCALIGEEVQARKMSLADVTNTIVNVIRRRHAEAGRDYGVVLIPEGIIEFIPEFGKLISEINDILVHEFAVECGRSFTRGTINNSA